jgi:outer membrane protein assembly factor BamA
MNRTVPCLPARAARLALAPLMWGAMALFVLGGIGCGGAKKRDEQYIPPGSTEFIVEEVRIDGAETFDPDDIRAGLATRSIARWRDTLSFVPIVGAEVIYFNKIEWRKDRQRIINFYRSRGYFDARIVGQRILENPEDGTVTIWIRISEGEPTLTEEIRVFGLETAGRLDPEGLVGDLPVERGTTFTESDYLQSKQQVLRRLKEASYAYAEVYGRVYIDDEKRRATIEIYCDPGPAARFGRVSIQGLESIPRDQVAESITVEPGRLYDAAELSTTQSRIYELGVFSLVSVQPEFEIRAEKTPTLPADGDSPVGTTSENASPDAPESGEPSQAEETTGAPPEAEDAAAPSGLEEAAPSAAEVGMPGALGISEIVEDARDGAASRARLDPGVDVIVTTQEARLSNLRLGAGFALSSIRQEAHGQANYSNRNFLGGLRKLEWFNTLGYAVVNGFSRSGISGEGNRGVVLQTELRFEQPQFLEERTRFFSTAGLRRDVQDGFEVWNPAARVGLRRRFWDFLELEISYDIDYYDYVDVNRSFSQGTQLNTALGLDFQPQFLLAALTQIARFDWRDSPLNPTRGGMLELSFSESDEALGSNFSFVRSMIEGEAYLPYELFVEQILAVRARIGSIYDLSPVQSRLFGGGNGSVRSFAARNLSPFTEKGRDPVPVGGLTLFDASIEPRFQILENLFDIGDVWGAVYLDAGTVLSQPLLIDARGNDQGVADFSDLGSSMLYGSGVGLWWVTPIGPVRLDFAYTLSSLAGDRRFQRCRLDPETTGVDPETCELIPPDEDPVLDQTVGLRYNFYLSVGHSF